LRKDEIEYVLLDDGSEGQIATVEILLPDAKITIMGELADVDGGLVSERTHVQVVPAGAVVLTRKAMGVIAERIMEDTGYDFIVIRGAVRTTGARPGHSPRDLRFP
jgi:stage V sporulation protein SpoVS